MRGWGPCGPSSILGSPTRKVCILCSNAMGGIYEPSMARKKRKEVISPQRQEGSKQKLQAIRLAMDQIEKQYGKGSIMRLGERANERMKVESIPTGSIALDMALGVWGLPRGRIVEVYGPEASGKTTLCLHIVAEAQKAGGQCAFVDAEHALDPARAEVIGVNLDELLLSQPDSGEQALEITETLIRSGGLDVVVVDSVAALVPRAELEGEMGDAIVGVQARLMSQALRKLTGAISKSKTILIFTNQIRQKIGVMFGNPETTPGGLALKFYSSVRLDIRRIEVLKDGDVVIGSRHRVRVVKNKVAPPLRVAEFDIMNDEGISKSGGVLDVAVDLGLIAKNGSFFNYDGKVLAQGREATKIYLKENSKFSKDLEKKIRDAFESGKKLPKEIGEEKK
jgi:recombination protein RecA